MLSPVLSHIKKFVALRKEEEDTILTLVGDQSVKKKEHLLKEGQVCRSNYFILKGCLRLYLVNDKGVEQATHFGIENWWMTDQMSLIPKSLRNFFYRLWRIHSSSYSIKHTKKNCIEMCPHWNDISGLFIKKHMRLHNCGSNISLASPVKKDIINSTIRFLDLFSAYHSIYWLLFLDLHPNS